MPTVNSLDDFRRSVTLDLYSPQDFIDWETIDGTIRRLKPAINHLQLAVRSKRGFERRLIRVIKDDASVLEVIRRLLIVRGSVGFADGRELPESVPNHSEQWTKLEELFTELGLWKILSASSSIADLLRIALIANDADRRRFRVRKKFGQEIKKLLSSAINTAQVRLGMPLRQLPPSEFPGSARGKTEYVIAVEGTPVVAVATVFQAISGGRQQRDLSLTYPSLQTLLDSIPLALALIVDGKGVKEAPDKVLETLFDGVASCMTLKQAQDGRLADALVEFGGNRGKRPVYVDPLVRIIDSSLASGDSVEAKDLPVDENSARLALAKYMEAYPYKALILSAKGTSIGWSRPNQIRDIAQLVAEFDAARAIGVFADLMKDIELGLEVAESDGELPAATLRLRPDTILPSEVLVVGHNGSISVELVRRIARRALHDIHNARLAFALVPVAPDSEGSNALRQAQNALPSNVVVLDTAGLMNIAQSITAPRDSLVSVVLEQSDLVKASPFVLSSVTPERMYFGREIEESNLLSTLGTNSVAIVGGRRIGKTSLMQHVRSRLAEADLAPFYGDCQTVRDWNDFGDLAQRSWNISLSHEFKPRNLFDLTTQLGEKSAGKLVILLDEIDQLLDWDSTHTEDEVPEAFFKACRTISQQGLAQFVFSGERIIATKLWDPKSPHWNFCRPLPLQQLNREGAMQLLIIPLRSLQITINLQEEFNADAWYRTSGHPQLLQYLGDKMVRLLNNREPDDRSHLDPRDLTSASENFEYAEHYLETYWGQSDPLERLVSLLVVEGVESPSTILERLEGEGVPTTEDQVLQALRMLELYGIVTRQESGYVLKAEWFPRALHYYGDLRQISDSLRRRLQ